MAFSLLFFYILLRIFVEHNIFVFVSNIECYLEDKLLESISNEILYKL